MSKDKIKTAVQNINNLLSIVKVEQLYENRNSNEPSITYGLGSLYPIKISGFQNLKTFNENIDKLFKHNGLKESLTDKTFTNAVIDLIRQLKIEDRNACEKDLEDFYDNIINQYELTEYVVFNELIGCKLKSQKVQLGDFVLYNLELSREELYNKYPTLRETEDIYFNSIKSNVLISLKVNAREPAKANDIADNYFTQFIHVVNFLVGGLDKYKFVQIKNQLSNHVHRSVICNDKGIVINNTSSNMRMIFDLEKEIKNISSPNIDNLWYLISKPNKTQIEKNLLLAIEWIGLAITEKDPAKSLISYVISIETMLRSKDKNITSQLAEWLAFLLESDYNKRMKIYNQFKELYGKRSSIAHNGSKSISKKDLITAFYFCKKMVITFLINDNLTKYNKIDDLKDYISLLKFTSPHDVTTF